MEKLKILMTTMSLDIGGAETHIVELSKRLALDGYDVSVASYGGVYVSELCKYGIKHFSVPLHNKHPLSMIKSYVKLYRLIKKEKYDIVHAHARIPAYICGLLQKRLKFRFVTTAHGTFEVTPLLRKMSNWGDLTLAVSYDIKSYLMKNYGIPQDNIFPTVNGIDTERFAESDAKISEKDGDDVSLPCIVHVSRLDKEVSCVAHMLIEAEGRFAEEGSPFSLVIVGDGTDFENVKKSADAVNEKYGKELITLTGARTDVDRILSRADIFVGVSRSALEAMASRKAVILAGSQGYGGIFEPGLLKLSLDTNFCFRGEKLPDTDTLCRDIKTLLSFSEEKTEALADFGSGIVCENYSVRKMADDAKAVYAKLSPYRPYKYGEVLLSGYYGFKNLGDDSLLQVIIDSLRREKKDIRITVLSKNPRQTAKRYAVNSINRFDIFKIARHMSHASLLINGGGSLLQNSTSTRSLLYYLSVMRMAKKRGLKLMIYAGGIGPLYGEKNKERVRRMLEEVDVITLREDESLAELKALGIKNEKVKVTLDPVFSEVPADEKWVRYLCAEKGIELSEKFFAVSMRTWNDADPDYERKTCDSVLVLKEKYGLRPLFVSMQREKDIAICERLAEECGGDVVDGFSASELCTVLSMAEFTLAMRLHALICSASVGTPVIGMAYDPKIKAMLDFLGISYMVDIRGFESDELCRICSEVYENREALREKLASETEKKRILSEQDARYAVALLDGPAETA